jgi:tRNA G18 (ribose-2'-O)-methylase SpoU
VLRVPFATLPVPGYLDPLRAAGFHLLALTPQPAAIPLSSVDPQLPRVALLLGAEGPGLVPETLAAADERVRIPMRSGVDSLNVATAAAIALHHFGR